MNQPPANNPYSAPQSSNTREPRRVKYIGLFWITGRTYCILQTCAFVVMLGLLAAWLWVPVPPQVADSPFYKFIPWVLIIAAVAETAEAFVMWRKFQSPEEEQ